MNYQVSDHLSPCITHHCLGLWIKNHILRDVYLRHRGTGRKGMECVNTRYNNYVNAQMLKAR